MICPNCKQENKDGSMYCNHCGAPLPAPQPTPVTPQKESNFSTMILLIWGAATIFMYFLNNRFFTGYISYEFGVQHRFIHLFLSLIQDALLVLPALAIPNKKLKIIGMVVMGVFAFVCMIVQMYYVFY